MGWSIDPSIQSQLGGGGGGGGSTNLRIQCIMGLWGEDINPRIQ